LARCSWSRACCRYTYDTLQGKAIASQSATAELVGIKIQTFIQSREDELQRLSSNIYRLDNLDLEDKTTPMSLLLTRQPVYQKSALLDPAGREQVRLSQSGVVPDTDLRDRADEPAFQVPAQTYDVYYSPVYFDPVPIKLNQLAAQYAADRAPLAERKALSLRFEGALISPVVQADERLLGQALSVELPVGGRGRNAGMRPGR
jgi:hypothetical protein